MADRCSIDGCNGSVAARGWCMMHYKRWRTHGDPLHITVKTPPSRRTHGQSFTDGRPTAEYRIWAGIKHRCRCPTANGWKRYGGRGISVCQKWSNSFEAFMADMGPRPSARHSIDRIDNNGNYEPGNCRWATRAVQCNNRRSNHYIEYKGERVTVTQLSKLCGVPLPRLKNRIRRGWSIERAVL